MIWIIRLATNILTVSSSRSSLFFCSFHILAPFYTLTISHIRYKIRFFCCTLTFYFISTIFNKLNFLFLHLLITVTLNDIHLFSIIILASTATYTKSFILEFLFLAHQVLLHLKLMQKKATQDHSIRMTRVAFMTSASPLYLAPSIVSCIVLFPILTLVFYSNPIQLI
jgi:hypothetical protein